MNQLLTPAERERLRELQNDQATRLLSAEEEREYIVLLEQIKVREARYLSPANQRLQKESEQLEMQNAKLATLVVRREKLVTDLQTFLTNVQKERAAISQEIKQTLQAV